MAQHKKVHLHHKQAENQSRELWGSDQDGSILQAWRFEIRPGSDLYPANEARLQTTPEDLRNGPSVQESVYLQREVKDQELRL